MTLEEALISHDLDDLIDRLTAYVYSRMKRWNVKDLNGLEPFDFVAELLRKVLERERDWQKANCSFKEFLFGALKSELYNFRHRPDAGLTTDLSDDEFGNSHEDSEELKVFAIQALITEGANEEELEVFKLWVEGIKKPAHVARELGTEASKIYVITKRLEKRLLKIQPQILKFNGQAHDKKN
jgi:hypothetical protein